MSNSKNVLLESVLDEDVQQFQKSLNDLLDNIYTAIIISERSDPDMDEDESADIEADLKGLGATVTSDDGVIVIDVTGKEQANKVCDYLEDSDKIDGYEIHTDSEESELDLDAIADDCKLVITAYIAADYIAFDPGYEDDDSIGGLDESVLSEVTKKIKVNALGKKRIKMQCNKGFKWNSTAKMCEKISGKDLATMRKAVRKTIMTKRGEGAALKTRVMRRTKKALRFRKAMGLRA